MIHTAKAVLAPILWANLHLLFWLSLIPFATGWMGENHFSLLPTQLYGFVLFMSAIAIGYCKMLLSLIRWQILF